MNLLLTIIFVLVCITLTVIVLSQEGNTQGLGSVNGIADTYWGKNKGRSIEGTLENITKVCAVLFLVLSLLLNIIK